MSGLPLPPAHTEASRPGHSPTSTVGPSMSPESSHSPITRTLGGAHRTIESPQHRHGHSTRDQPSAHRTATTEGDDASSSSNHGKRLRHRDGTGAPGPAETREESEADTALRVSDYNASEEEARLAKAVQGSYPAEEPTAGADSPLPGPTTAAGVAPVVYSSMAAGRPSSGRARGASQSTDPSVSAGASSTQPQLTLSSSQAPAQSSQPPSAQQQSPKKAPPPPVQRPQPQPQQPTLLNMQHSSTPGITPSGISTARPSDVFPAVFPTTGMRHGGVEELYSPMSPDCNTPVRAAHDCDTPNGRGEDSKAADFAKQAAGAEETEMVPIQESYAGNTLHASESLSRGPLSLTGDGASEYSHSRSDMVFASCCKKITDPDEWRHNPPRVHGLERPLHMLQIIAFMVTLLGVGFFWSSVFPGFILVYIDTRSKSCLAELVIFSVLIGIGIIILYVSWVVVTVRENADLRNQGEVCTYCNRRTDTKSKHCKACNKCIEGFDHHCKWLNVCVGAKNYRAFIMYITSATLTMLVALISSIVLVAQWWNVLADHSVWFRVGPFFLMLLMLIGAPFTGHLLGFHIMINIRSVTSYEYILMKREEKLKAIAEDTPRGGVLRGLFCCSKKSVAL